MSGCKSPERSKSVAVGPSRIIEETDELQIVAKSMEPVPSNSEWVEESGLSEDFFFSWKKDTVRTICDQLSERQRSAFIFVSTLNTPT